MNPCEYRLPWGSSIAIAFVCCVLGACDKSLMQATPPTAQQTTNAAIAGAGTHAAGTSEASTAGAAGIVPIVGAAGAAGQAVTGVAGAMVVAGTGGGTTASAAGSSAAAAGMAADAGTAGDAAGSGTLMDDAGPNDDMNAQDGCSRAALAARVHAYYAALEAHDASTLPLADGVKYTENGKTVVVGDGLWKTAGSLTFKRSALDTQQCTSVTESVITEGSASIVLGLRLKANDGALTEIESIIARSSEPFSNPAALADSASDDWETVLPMDQQPTRETLSKIVDLYFSKFPNGACNFASSCRRLENGFSPGSCTGLGGIGCDPERGGNPSMPVRLVVVDVEASIGIGFTLWRNASTDFHLFKVRDGEVQAVHAVLARATTSGWD